MKRLVFSMAVLAICLVSAHASNIVWDRGPAPGGQGGVPHWTAASLGWTNTYQDQGGNFSWADGIVLDQGLTFSGYVHYSDRYSTDPGYYRLRIWSDGTFWEGTPRPWALLDELILTATSVESIGGLYKITFAFDSITLPATVTWPNGTEVQAIYFIGLTSASPEGDAGQWFLAGGFNGGVVLINDWGGPGTYFAGTAGTGQQAYQLLGTVDQGPGGSVPEPATAGVVALGLAFAAGLRRAASRAGAER